MKFEKLGYFYNKIFKSYKIASIKHYQNNWKIYLDEYPEQKEERLSFFMREWNLKSNQGIKNTG